MKKFVCELCGSSNLTKQGDSFVCGDCLTSYSVEEARRLMVEVEDTVDNNPELKNLYELARRARREDNEENAEKYYSQIAIKCPFDWEANFYQVYFACSRCKIRDIGSTQLKFAAAIKSAVSLISEHVKSDEEKVNACKEIINAAIGVARGHYNSAKNWYNGCSWSIRGRFTQDMLNYTYPCVLTAYAAGDEVDKYFGNDYPELHSYCVKAWKTAVELHKEILPRLADTAGHSATIEEHKRKIVKYEPSYGASFVSTAPTTNTNTTTTVDNSQPKAYGTAAIIFAFFIPLVGLILAISSYKNPDEKKKCVAAIVISLANMLLSFFIMSGMYI